MTSLSAPSKPLDEYIAEYLHAVGRGQLPDPTGHLERSEERRVAFLQAVRVARESPSRRPESDSPTTGGATRIEGGTGDTSRSPSSVIRSLQHVPPAAIGNYDVLRELGRGGMGVVYVARHRQSGQRVALKVLHNAISRDPTYQERLRRESLAHLALQHDHVVGLIETGVDAEGIPFLVMEWVDGVGLDQLIRRLRSEDPSEASTATAAERDPPLRTPAGEQPIERCLAAVDRSQYLRWMVARIADVADALHLAHEQAMVHRDVKPSNILIDVDGKAWLTDFGLAALGDETTAITATDDVLGTLAFMSPEQAQGARDQPLDRRSDIYSLGVTLYQATTLEKPFRGTRADVLYALLQGHYLLPSQRNRSIPPELDVVIDRAMAFNPRDRYQSAAEFASELRRFAHGQRVQTRRPMLAQRAFRWCEKNPRLASVAATSALLLVLAVLAVQTFNSISIGRLNRDLERTNQDLETSHQALWHSERRLRRELYVADMAAAFEAFDENDLSSSRRILDRYRRPSNSQEDQRGTAWRLLERLTRTVSNRELARHEGGASEVAIVPDGSFGLSVGKDGYVRRFGLLSADQPRHAFHVGDRLDAIAVLPSQDIFLTGKNVPEGYNPVATYDMRCGTWRAQPSEHWGSVESVAVSPSGRWMASAARYHDVTVFDEHGTVRGESSTNSRNETLAFIDEDRLLVTRQFEDDRRDVYVWNLSTDEEQKVSNASGTQYFAISGEPGSQPRRLLLASDAEIYLLQWPSLKVLARPHHLGARVRTVDIAEDGHVLVVGTDEGAVFHWDLQEWQPDKQRSLPKPQVVQASSDRITCVRYLDAYVEEPRSASRSVSQVVTASEDGFVKLWMLPTEPLTHWDTLGDYGGADVEQMLLDPDDDDGVYLACADGKFLRLDTKRLTSRVVCDLQQPIEGYGNLLASRRRAYLPIAAGLAEIDLDHPADVVRVLKDHGPQQICHGVVEVSEGLVACYHDHLVLYDIDSGVQKQVLPLPQEGATQILAHPDERSAVVVGSEMGNFRVVDGRVQLWKENRVAAETTNRAQFSSDGQMFATALDDHSLRVQWLDESRPDLRFSGHQGQVQALVFLDQDRLLASVATDRTLRFWDLSTGRALGVLQGIENCAFLGVSPDQTHLVAGHDRGSFSVWDLR